MTAVNIPLAPNQMDQIRGELLRTLTRLERSMKISGQTDRARDLEQDTVGRLSRIDALQNQGLTRSLEERERTQLTQIVEALRRIEDGTYGSCGGCGGPIPFERLMVYPETLACTACVTAR
ncbi:MAG TPA: TraR/DksA C4-type zinc finger protein [Longimicrobiaceae bacterium]|jgi:DnaK suppressor protein|nr:TraR/DksA C4-type zinc finger protein [Longimicrobiaceae bacterium]